MRPKCGSFESIVSSVSCLNSAMNVVEIAKTMPQKTKKPLKNNNKKNYSNSSL